MSEASRFTPESSNPGGGKTIRVAARAVLYFALSSALAITAYATFRATQDEAQMKETGSRLMAVRGLIQPVRKRLAPRYSDKDGRLLADRPSDLQQLLDPDPLVVAHYIDADVDTQLVDWDDFEAHLAKATGKRVVRQEYRNTVDDVAAVNAGKIQVVALHAADTPYVVNNAGFIPVAVLGSEAGANGNQLVIAVSPKSKIQALSDLRGRTLTCTEPHSMTGYRAAIVALSQQAGLGLDVDYTINFSLGQKRSILGLVAGDFEVATLSDDKLQSMLKKGSIKTSDYRVIYRSQVIPRLTIGYTYNLEPELAAKVTSAALDFRNAGGAVEESTPEPMHFRAIDYKRDFELVRNIDDCFDPRFTKTPKAEPTPTGSPFNE